MLRRALAVILIICLQGLSFAGLLATIGFRMNRTYIAAKLCENRAKPKLECMGKCYLKKMQKTAEEQKDANENTLKDVYCVMPVQSQTGFFYAIDLRNLLTEPDTGRHCKGWPRQSFHPPGFIC